MRERDTRDTGETSATQYEIKEHVDAADFLEEPNYLPRYIRDRRSKSWCNGTCRCRCPKERSGVGSCRGGEAPKAPKALTERWARTSPPSPILIRRAESEKVGAKRFCVQDVYELVLGADADGKPCNKCNPATVLRTARTSGCALLVIGLELVSAFFSGAGQATLYLEDGKERGVALPIAVLEAYRASKDCCL